MACSLLFWNVQNMLNNMENKIILKNLKLNLIHELDFYCSPFCLQPNFMGSCESDNDF